MASSREIREQEARVWALETLRIQRLVGAEESSLDDLIHEHMNFLTLQRTGNGWGVALGSGDGQFTFVATTPDELVEYVRKWATIQLEG